MQRRGSLGIVVVGSPDTPSVDAMATRTTVIAGCTSRKAVAPPPWLQLRTVTAVDRLGEWMARIEKAEPILSPTDLYRGEAWRQALALVRGVLGARPYVLSAGHGLTSFDSPVATYSATLSPGHPDSVPQRPSDGHVASEWMRGLLARNTHRSVDDHLAVAAVARAHPTEPVLVCLGRTYAEAVSDDLREASVVLHDPELLSVFCSGPPIDGLERSWVAVPGKLRLVLGGTLGSVALRAASAVVQATGHDPVVASRSRSEIARLSATAPTLPHVQGQRSSDEAVREWIGGYLRKHPTSSAWRALKIMRSEGLACEQGRFRTLFEGGTR